MTGTSPDIIDALAGIRPGDALDTLRTRRPVTREEAQKSHLALFAPESQADATLAERHAVALFVALLHDDSDLAGLHARALEAETGGAALLPPIRQAGEAGRGRGPYGHYPAGPLSVEDAEGPELALPDTIAEALGPRLAAALAHAHLLVFHPRDARPTHLSRLHAAGWSPTGIVTLSQLVAFLTFQIRVAAGLKALAQA